MVTDAKNNESVSYKIDTNSLEHAKFINWIDRNPDGWQNTPASYVGDVVVKQKNFTLIRLSKEGVMVSFKDDAGNPKQYTKDSDRKELEFLQRP